MQQTARGPAPQACTTCAVPVGRAACRARVACVLVPSAPPRCNPARLCVWWNSIASTASYAAGEDLVDAEDLAAALTLMPHVRAELDETELGLLMMSRGHGLTWMQIAEAQGLGSAQAAQQRHDRLAGQKLEDRRSPTEWDQPNQVAGPVNNSVAPTDGERAVGSSNLWSGPGVHPGLPSSGHSAARRQKAERRSPVPSPQLFARRPPLADALGPPRRRS